MMKGGKIELIQVPCGNPSATIFFPLSADETEDNSINYRKTRPEPVYMADSILYRTLHSNSGSRRLSQR